jgi:hypothetical protein
MKPFYAGIFEKIGISPVRKSVWDFLTGVDSDTCEVDLKEHGDLRRMDIPDEWLTINLPK